jgi:hypothetical protein
MKQVRVPWAEPRSRFTPLMKRLIIDLIRQCSTVKGACQIARVSWDEASGIISGATSAIAAGLPDGDAKIVFDRFQNHARHDHGRRHGAEAGASRFRGGRTRSRL